MNSKTISTINEKSLLTTFEDLGQDLVRFLAYSVGSYCVAQDLYHEVYLRLRKIDRHSTMVKNPKAYIYKIARNIAFDHLRMEKNFSKYIEEKSKLNKLPLVSSPEVIIEKEEEIGILYQAINELPIKCRKVFVLSKFHNLTYTEISVKLKISVSAVEKHVMKGLAHCRDRLNNIS